MSIYRVNKNNNFTAIDNRFANDPNLSAKAKGILLYLITKPENWKVYENDIVKHMRDGKDAIRSGLTELVTARYIVRAQSRISESGKFDGYDYDVFEYPRSVWAITKQESRIYDIYETGHRSECVGSHGLTGEQVGDTHTLAAVQNREGEEYQLHVRDWISANWLEQLEAMHALAAIENREGRVDANQA